MAKWGLACSMYFILLVHFSVRFVDRDYFDACEIISTDVLRFYVLYFFSPGLKQKDGPSV